MDDTPIAGLGRDFGKVIPYFPSLTATLGFDGFVDTQGIQV